MWQGLMGENILFLWMVHFDPSGLTLRGKNKAISAKVEAVLALNLVSLKGLGWKSIFLPCRSTVCSSSLTVNTHPRIKVRKTLEKSKKQKHHIWTRCSQRSFPSLRSVPAWISTAKSNQARPLWRCPPFTVYNKNGESVMKLAVFSTFFFLARCWHSVIGKGRWIYKELAHILAVGALWCCWKLPERLTDAADASQTTLDLITATLWGCFWLGWVGSACQTCLGCGGYRRADVGTHESIPACLNPMVPTSELICSLLNLKGMLVLISKHSW